MKIYLDLCAIQRLLDTPNQVRIVLESEAVLGLIAYCDTGQAKILSSEALLYEGEQGSLSVRREHTLAVLAKANEVIEFTEKEKNRAAEFLQFGIKPLDALFIWHWLKQGRRIISALVTTGCYEARKDKGFIGKSCKPCGFGSGD